MPGPTHGITRAAVSANVPRDHAHGMIHQIIVTPVITSPAVTVGQHHRPIGRCQDVRITPLIGVGETIRLPGERDDGDELHSRTLPAQSEDRFGGR